MRLTTLELVEYNKY